ncbi:hypothetical protein BDZ45DRAFT_741603 [Acephala macrosclerotiorum]|nr:hypothetical protein BDZ45DRAFT_741603 [Acephala macrosclerotiorum]
MPLPNHAFTLHGGCNCHAIRYKIDVPVFKDRFLHPTRHQEHLPEEDKIRFPMSLICHCNDSRSSSGALINYGLACLNEYVSFKFELRPSSSSDQVQTEEKLSKEWIPASSIFPPSPFPERKDTYLSFYQSSEKPWPKFLDIWTGTIDKAGLEREGEDEKGEWLRPVGHIWVDVEIPWVGRLACEGSGRCPRHEGRSDFA